MNKYDDHAWVLSELQLAQEADSDLRQEARDDKSFLIVKDGQWESKWWQQQKDSPRYTFDVTTNVVNQIADKIMKADFAGDIKPMGGGASEENAEILDGLVRNIQTISNASQIYNPAARSMVVGGMDGWEVVQEYQSGDSFDQSLMVKRVPNFIDRVWFQSTAEEQDRSDANYGWMFSGYSPEAFEAEWPEHSQTGMDAGKSANVFFNKPDLIMVGNFFYKKEVEQELVLMSNDAVYVVDDKYQSVADDLEKVGITEIRRRKRKTHEVWVRKMNGVEWLGKATKTVFSYIPLIPCYGNYEVFEDKSVFYGAVRKLTDPQRVLNYSLSREIGEGALAPRAKYWMTKKQAAGHEVKLSTLNTNDDPVQFYNPDGEVPGPPQQSGGAQINPGLRIISDAMQKMIPQSAGQFNASQGNNPNAQSGIALEKLQDRGDVGSVGYFSSLEVAISHTMRILIKAIPKVYVGRREERILREDGSHKMITLNDSIIDEQTGQEVVLNDLSIGEYDVTCTAGKQFQNRQEETLEAILSLAQYDPSILQIGSDIILNQIQAPGMDELRERRREELFKAGGIPESQMTDEEKQKLQQIQQQQAQNPPPPDPMMVAAKAEENKAQAAMMAQQNKQMEIQIKQMDNDTKNQLAQFKMQMEEKSRSLDEYLKVVEIQLKEVQAYKLSVEAREVSTQDTPAMTAAVNEQAVGIADGVNQ